MAPVFLDPGLLTKRLALEQNAAIVDASGGARENWIEVGEVSARVEPLGVDVRQRLDQRIGTATHRVTLRARSGIDRGMAFRLGSRRLLVRTIQDPDESGRYLVCRCEEEV